MMSAMDIKWMNKSPKKFEYFLQQQRLNPPGEPTGKGKQPLNYKNSSLKQIMFCMGKRHMVSTEVVQMIGNNSGVACSHLATKKREAT